MLPNPDKNIVMEELLETGKVVVVGGTLFYRVDYKDGTSKYKPATGKHDSHGYRTISVQHNGHKWGMLQHRLVYLAYYGEFPEDKPYVDHMDRNRSNNNPNNLRAVDALINATENHYRACRERSGHARLVSEEVEAIRLLHASRKYSQQEIADMFGIHSSHVSSIVLHKKWK